MLRRRRVHVVFIAMSVCQQLAAAIERKDSIVNDSLTSSLTLFGYTSVKPVQLEAIHDLLSGKNVLVTVPTVPNLNVCAVQGGRLINGMLC